MTEADAKATAEAATESTVAVTMSQPAERGTGTRQHWPLAQRSTRSRLAWADIAQASGRGRGFTWQPPRLGRVGHVDRGKRSLPARALRLKMIWASTCLRVGMPAAVRRAQCRVRGAPKPRAAGGALQGRAARRRQGLAHLRALGCFRACSHLEALAGVQTNLVCSRGETVVRTLLTPLGPLLTPFKRAVATLGGPNDPPPPS